MKLRDFRFPEYITIFWWLIFPFGIITPIAEMISSPQYAYYDAFFLCLWLALTWVKLKYFRVFYFKKKKN